MSLGMKVIEFEKRQAHLSDELDSGPPFTVHGIALGDDDITRGASGIKKLWPADELKKAAESLEGRNLVVDHNNDSDGVVGKVTKAGYEEGVGVLYEAELYDEDLATKISHGLLEVSVRGYHKDVDEMDENEEGAKVVTDIEFDNLSIVPQGASPSNTLEMGAAESLTAAELADHISALRTGEDLDEHFDEKSEEDEDEEDSEEEDSEEDDDSEDEEEEAQEEIEAGDWVQWDGNHGIAVSMPEDGEVEVDIYEESDGKWRSTGSTEMVSVNSLSMWEVDDDDIGAAEDEGDSEEEDSDDEETSDEEEEAKSDNPDVPMPEEVQLLYPTEEIAERVAEQMGISGYHSHNFEGDEWFMPGETHEVFVERMNEFAQMDEQAAEDLQELEAALSAHGFMDEEDEEEENVTSKSVPSKSAKPTHDPDGDTVDPDEEENVHRDGGEGSEDVGKQGKENQPWRYPDIDGDEESDEPEDSGDFEENESEEESDEDVEELVEYKQHNPDWSGTTTAEWSSPDMEDFDTDDLEEIAKHFLISSSGFPPENFSDLKLPVVEPSGELNVNALAAVKGGRGVSAVEGLSDSMEEEIIDWVNSTANEEFDKEWGMEEEEAGVHKMDPEMEDDKETEMMNPVDISLDLINMFLRINGKDERDSVDKMLGWMFSSTDIPGEKMEAFRTAANAFLDQQGGADSFDAVNVEGFRSWLLTQGGQTDDGVHARPTQPTSGSGVPRIATPVHVLSGDDLRTVDMMLGASKKADDSNTEINNMTEDIEQKLAELNEPVAVEKSDFESLQEKADRFDEMSENLDALRERTDVLDSVDREQVDELAESEDPVVLESAEYEELTAEAEQVKAVYAEALSNEGPFSAEDLVDKFSIEELREKYEEIGGDLEEELNPAPKGNDPSEEELEEKAEEENKSSAELEKQEAIEAKQEELRQKIRGN